MQRLFSVRSTLADQKQGVRQTLKWIVNLARHLMGTFSGSFCLSRPALCL
jgi:hypothetical protein